MMSSGDEILEKLLEISVHLSETRVLDPLLNYAMDVALELVGAEYGYLVLLNDDASLNYRVKRGLNGDLANAQASRSILGEVIETREPIVTADAMEDPLFGDAESVQSFQVRSVMCLPLIARERVLGALYVENRSSTDIFDDDDLRPLRFFAGQAAVAIDNAVLNDELEARVAQRTAELQDAHDRLQREMEERQRAQQKLIQLAMEEARAQALASFVRDASHEFRTPLTVIQTGIELLDRLNDEQKRQRHMLAIREQLAYLNDLVDALIVMANLDSGALQNARAINLNQLMRHAYDAYAATAQENGLNLQLELQPKLPRVVGSDHELNRAIAEFVDNALRYTPSGGEIVLRTASDADYVLFEVMDTGIGMDEATLARIFDRFFRADEARSTRGIGLGLSIARQIVIRHQGLVAVESQPQQGTRFIVWLPRADRL